MTDAEVTAAITLYEAELGIPATDALSRPTEELVEHGPGRLPRDRGAPGRRRAMTAPRLEIDLAKLHHNARTLVDRLGARGVAVTAVTKGTLGSTAVAVELLRAGVRGLGDSRIENVEALRDAGVTAPITLIRSPMPSQVDRVVAHADVSVNTEMAVLRLLSAAAVGQGRIHGVVLMVELGDLREGILPGDLLGVVRRLRELPAPPAGRDRRQPGLPERRRPRCSQHGGAVRPGRRRRTGHRRSRRPRVRRELGQPRMGIRRHRPRTGQRPSPRRSHPARPGGPATPAGRPAAHRCVHLGRSRSSRRRSNRPCRGATSARTPSAWLRPCGTVARSSRRSWRWAYRTSTSPGSSPPTASRSSVPAATTSSSTPAIVR